MPIELAALQRAQRQCNPGGIGWSASDRPEMASQYASGASASQSRANQTSGLRAEHLEMCFSPPPRRLAGLSDARSRVVPGGSRTKQSVNGLAVLGPRSLCAARGGRRLGQVRSFLTTLPSPPNVHLDSPSSFFHSLGR